MIVSPFHTYLGKICSMLLFQMGWPNYQLVTRRPWLRKEKHAGKGDSYWKPSFLGAKMLGRVPPPKNYMCQGRSTPIISIFFRGWETQPKSVGAYIPGWWFQTCFIFTPIPGEMIQFDEHIFQRGWNHQLDKDSVIKGGRSPIPNMNILLPPRNPLYPARVRDLDTDPPRFIVHWESFWKTASFLLKIYFGI